MTQRSVFKLPHTPAITECYTFITRLQIGGKTQWKTLWKRGLFNQSSDTSTCKVWENSENQLEASALGAIFFRTEHIFLPCGARKNNFHLRAISLVRFAHFATLSPADLARKWADKSSREKNIQSLVFVFFGLFFWRNYSKPQRNINGFCLQYRLTTWTVFVDLIYGLRICVSFFANRIHFQLGSVLIKLCHATLI